MEDLNRILAQLHGAALSNYIGNGGCVAEHTTYGIEWTAAQFLTFVIPDIEKFGCSVDLPKEAW